MSEQSGCPPRNRLEAFVIGDLPLAELDEIAAHVSSCETCDHTLAQLDGGGDALVSFLRRVGEPAPEDSMVDDPVPADLVRSARSAFPAHGGGSSSSGTLTMDAGRKMLSALEEGAVRLGRYEILEELGHGTFGYVFRARDVELDRVVAIKVQRAGESSGGDEERFFREARSAAALDHPRIVSIFDTGRTADGAPYLVTEFVEGETLAERLGGLPRDATTAASWVAEVAEALQYAHDHGVIHRDLKPSNILIDRGGHPHVLDFGLAKLDGGEATLTPHGEAVGTPAYMSPEQARDSHSVDARSDVYSMGVVLYELLTGGPPFQGNRRMVMLQVLEDEPRPPRQLLDTIPRDLETISLKAMSKSPVDRYATAGALAADLRRFLAGEPIVARPLTRLERLQRWCVRYPLPAGVVGAVMLGSVAGWLYLTHLTESLVRGAARHSAELQAEALEELNSFYSELIDGLDGTSIEITHEYASKRNALPLPATFTIAAGERISRSASGMQIRLYSDYPFPWRRDGGPRDDFERRALEALRAAPDEPVWEFAELDGREVVRFAKARLMTESCLSCHNTHPDTPKDDWELGDVRGVLEILRPVATDHAATRRGLRGTFVLAVATTLILIGFAAGTLLVTNRRRAAAREPRPRPRSLS